jgi:hypothetical protein
MKPKLKIFLVGLGVFFAVAVVLVVVSPVLPPRVECSDKTNGAGQDCPENLNPTVQWLGLASLKCQLSTPCTTATISEVNLSWLRIPFNIAVVSGIVILAGTAGGLVILRLKDEH